MSISLFMLLIVITSVLADFRPNVNVAQQPDEPANSALLHMGLLGCLPVQPTVAIDLTCLELYHQIRCRQSSFSMQSITKVLCALHNVTYSQLTVHLAETTLTGICQALVHVVPLSNRTSRHLIPERLHSMDGNHSAKRLDGSGSADERVFNSKYFIPMTVVELFRDDVRNRPGEHRSENWTAAKPVEENKIFVFEQTGIFILYGLTVTNRLLDICGNDQALGHNIGCSLRKTIAASSIGVRAKAQNLIVAVNSFYGYAHNCCCQLQNHPLYLEGFGNEDLETCERIFSSYNSAAVLIRHVSHFHWKQFLDLHFDQWDCDKYLELSRFLCNNYVQALKIIEDYMALLEEFKSWKSLADQDFIQWHQEEVEFLSNLAIEPPSDVLAVAYIEELEKLRLTESAYGSVTSVPFLTYTPMSFTQTSGLNASARRQSRTVEAECASVLCRYELQMNVVDDFEQWNGINERWTIAHPEYTQALKYSHERCFIWTANLVGTALEKYNKLAPLQTPPRPVLDYSKVVGYATLGEFSLLKYSRHDLLSKPWAVPDNREMAARYFKVVRLHKEITRLNVKICCLDAWVEYDDAKVLEVIETLTVEEADSLLAAEFRQQYNERHRINNIYHHHLNKIRYLKGYSGQAAALLHGSVEMENLDDEREPVDLRENDELNDEAFRLEDAISHL
ncbi:uncharacterized protein EDB91DRAFT_1086933 [Suillus paluster]|uniref:uncharacterized protein n=1 Tax=Suillus paluster TaxID=48578 RepID=UPI001B872E9C|nr:uncharacterized protein EDB91DRAFT_1086933 [Suillus paluster]KAG1726020.1 hypothetical protein EDB91DRAFT_1086933 [Suillus paluster]